MKFRKKPVVVDAVQWTGDMAVARSFIGPDVAWRFGDDPGDIEIDTQAGWMTAIAGDWLVRANGQVWVVESDLFAILYEPAGSVDE